MRKLLGLAAAALVAAGCSGTTSTPGGTAGATTGETSGVATATGASSTGSTGAGPTTGTSGTIATGSTSGPTGGTGAGPTTGTSGTSSTGSTGAGPTGSTSTTGTSGTSSTGSTGAGPTTGTSGTSTSGTTGSTGSGPTTGTTGTSSSSTSSGSTGTSGTSSSSSSSGSSSGSTSGSSGSSGGASVTTFAIPQEPAGDGTLRAISPAASGIAVGGDVWITFQNQWGVHSGGNAYLLRIDASGNETAFELPGCDKAGVPALWAGHGQLVVPCLGAINGSQGGPLGDGKVMLFDLASGQVVQSWDGGADAVAVTAGDRALILDETQGQPDATPPPTGPIVIDLASGSAVHDSAHEPVVCQDGVPNALGDGTSGAAAMMACGTSTGVELVPLDGSGAATGAPRSTTASAGGLLPLFDASSQRYLLSASPCAVQLFSASDGSSQSLDVCGSDGQQTEDTAARDGSIFAVVMNRSGNTMLVRARDTGSGLAITDRVPLDGNPLAVFATSANEVWVATWSALTRVRFP